MKTSRTKHCNAGQSRRSGGFTLIELVVAMLIAATLAAIAIPAYSNYARKAHRVEAKNALLDLGTMEERYFTSQQVYSTTWADLGFSGTASTVNTGNNYYAVSTPVVTVAVAPDATHAGSSAMWSITATAINDQLKDTNCRTFTVTSQGLQSSTDSGGNPSTGCW